MGRRMPVVRSWSSVNRWQGLCFQVEDEWSSTRKKVVAHQTTGHLKFTDMFLAKSWNQMHEHARYRHGPRRNNWHSFFVRAQTGQGVEVLSVCFFNCMMAPKARVALTLVLDPENNTNTQLLLLFSRAASPQAIMLPMYKTTVPVTSEQMIRFDPVVFLKPFSSQPGSIW
ncbi:hypothetical protein NC651_020447 [Populus alba x Populus x berolinensis]|nr:hypothetical protein NC651_020447 [Populus alba x Populus x berolinensis]